MADIHQKEAVTLQGIYFVGTVASQYVTRNHHEILVSEFRDGKIIVVARRKLGPAPNISGVFSICRKTSRLLLSESGALHIWSWKDNTDHARVFVGKHIRDATFTSDGKGIAALEGFFPVELHVLAAPTVRGS